MFCTRRSRSSGLRVFFQKFEGWLKLSSSPELYLQSTTRRNEFLPFSCSAYDHYYHTDNQHANYVIHIAIFNILTLHNCVSTYETNNSKTQKGCRLKEGAEWAPDVVNDLVKKTSSFPCQEINQNSPTMQPTA